MQIMATKQQNPALEFLRRSAQTTTSDIRVLFTSKSSAGAWQIRGEQMAAMRTNWFASNQPTDEEISNCDVLCVVKKPVKEIVERARNLRKAIVFDIVDSWAQPADSLKCQNLSDARDLFRRVWRAQQFDGYIFPTRRMQVDLGSLVSCGITIYHHYWPQIGQNPIREKVETVGYQGGNFLGDWRYRLEEACADRNLRFIENPSSLTDLDVVVLARGGPHGGFLERNYKSNVKLANAYGSGTPALVHFKEMSAHDTDCGDVLFFTDRPGSFERQLDRLIENQMLRKSMQRSFLTAAKRYHIENIATQFEAFFREIYKRHKGM